MPLNKEDIDDLKDTLELLTRNELELLTVERFFYLNETVSLFDKKQDEKYLELLGTIEFSIEDQKKADEILYKFGNEWEKDCSTEILKNDLKTLTREQLEIFAVDRSVRLNETIDVVTAEQHCEVIRRINDLLDEEDIPIINEILQFVASNLVFEREET